MIIIIIIIIIIKNNNAIATTDIQGTARDKIGRKKNYFAGMRRGIRLF